MKRILLSLALFLLPQLAFAQCNGVFSPNTVCGTVAGGIPGQVSTSVLTGIPAGTSGQVQYNSGSNTFAGFTMSGDCTLVPTTGVITCPRTNGTLFANPGSATTDATNASNISTGILAAARLSTGVAANVLNTQTLPYTIGNTDCGKTINIAGGPGTLALPSVSGFSGTCTVRVCNTAANSVLTHAFILSGFPSPSLPHLWMGQCQGVGIINGAWASLEYPGRFVPSFVPTCYADTGGNNTNDGLVSNAAANAVKDPQECILIWNLEIDLGGSQPTIAPTGGQTNQQSGGAGPLTLIGNVPKVVFVQGNGGVATLQSTTSNFVAQVQDFGGYFIFSNVIIDCNNATHPCFALFMHQQGGADINASVTFRGAGATDYGIYCDSFCKINGNNLVTIAGSFLDAFNGNLGSVISFSNGLTISNSTTVASDVFLTTGGSQLVYGGPLTLGTGTTISELFGGRGNSMNCINMGTVTGTFTGVRQWSMLNSSVLSNISATAIPGSVAGINTLATFSAGVIVNSGVSAGGC